MGQPVVHWEIAGKDAAKLQRFYSELFDWKVTVDEDLNYGVVETGDEGGIDGGIFTPPNGAAPYTMFYIHVDDIQQYLNKIESLGGQTQMPPMEIPGVGSAAVFSDPDGNSVGLFRGQTVS
jgi:predicted enzyme related to lactoylglutathione lyase